MPLLKLEIAGTLSDEQREALLVSLSRIVAETVGKPEQYVMVTVSPAAMMMSGQAAAAAFVDVRSIGGLGPDVNRRLSQKLCQLLNESLGVPANRVYLNFTDVRASHWGWNGTTFG